MLSRNCHALLCLRSCIRRKRADDLYFPYSAEETLSHSVCFAFRSRYITVLVYTSFFLLYQQTYKGRKGETVRKWSFASLSLPVSQKKTESGTIIWTHHGVLWMCASEKHLYSILKSPFHCTVQII